LTERSNFDSLAPPGHRSVTSTGQDTSLACGNNKRLLLHVPPAS